MDQTNIFINFLLKGVSLYICPKWLNKMDNISPNLVIDTSKELR